ncbi:MAG: polysaccharide deacetylase family protein [Verrucomicrobia bacterium]|nr:polysaccharide deacetylase family protein [Verrucomicrobiota bacterium]
MKSLVVSLHDVSPLTQTLCENILAQLQELGIQQTSLLVIPNHHRRAPITENASFRSWLVRKVEAGHEPVLHGYFHQRQRQKTDSLLSRLTTETYTAGEGEFFDLSTDEASSRLRRGLEDLAFLPRNVVGFVAPAWLLGAAAEMAVREIGFWYTTRLSRFQSFRSAGDVRSRSLVWSTRAEWRAWTSLAWNRCLAIATARTRLIRIGIHPSDLGHAAVWRQVKQLVAAAMPGRDCVSYEKFLEIFRR